MIILFIVIIMALIGVDQLVKYWSVHTLQPKGSMDFIHFGDFEVLDLTYLENDGAVFGSMSGQRWFLIGFTSLLIIVGIVLIFRSKHKSKVYDTALILYVAGGIGNLIDRIRFGYVVDMFEVKLFDFAIFNVADIYVVFAVALLFVYILIIEPKLSKAEDKIEKVSSNE